MATIAVATIADPSSIKEVPSKFHFPNDRTALTCDSVPVIDFSTLVAGNEDERAKALNDLGSACREWGIFILVNHGIPETLMNSTFTEVKEFLSLPESEKKQYQGTCASSPIKCGNLNIANDSDESFSLWRDYIKMYVHPEFNCPDQTPLLREVVREYSQGLRKLARKLLEDLCHEVLELDEHYVDHVLKLDSSFQIFGSNNYPPCPRPDLAIGLPPHTDPGLMTLLTHNGVAGLQIEREGKWFNVNSPQNSILVNVADQLQTLSNGRFKSVKHRAVVNSEKRRISIAVSSGPSLEAVIGPAEQLVEKDGGAKYVTKKYREFVMSQFSNAPVDA